MLKIVVAMLIGVGLGAALTHEIMSRQQETAPAGPNAAFEPAAEAERPGVPPAASPGLRILPGGPGGEGIARRAAVPPPEVVAAAPDPTGRVDRLVRQPGAREPDPAIGQGVSFSAAFDEALRRSTESRTNLTSLSDVAEAWLRESPSAAIAALDRLASQDQRWAYISGLARSAIVNRPEELGEIVARLRGPNEQSAMMNSLGQAVASHDTPEALLGVTDSLPGMVGSYLERIVYGQIAQRDPLSALAGIDSMPPGESREILMMDAVTQLALRDPNAALSWLSAQQGTLSPNVYMNVASILTQQHPEAAAQYTSSVPESARGEWITAVATGMAGQDVDSALSWLSTWRNTSYYGDAIAGVAQQLAGFDPPRAAQLLGQVDVQSRRGAAALTTVAMVWSNSDPAAAVEWARSLPRGESRDRALTTLAPQIGEPMLQDSMLDLFSSEMMRNSAAAAVITTIARTDPGRAQALTQTHISDPAMAQRIGTVLEGGQPGFATAISMPIGAGVPPPGRIFYSAGGSVPQLTVIGDGANNFIVRQPAVEQ